MHRTPYLLVIGLTALSLFVSAAGPGDRHLIIVSNDSEIRRDEIVEIDLSYLRSSVGRSNFIITDSSGRNIAYQITFDSLLIFPVSLDSGSSDVFYVNEGIPPVTDTIAWGGFFPERLDDIAWENDRSAYRTYGPALQRSGERAFGYDIWTKSVSHPVVAKRYHGELSDGISYHIDHGEGMDAYSVGPTLGAGTAAIIDSVGEPVLPYCYRSYEILDNGPLRFTVRLEYESSVCPEVYETRTISLDAGEYLNRTAVKFIGLTGPADVAPGIVVHRQNPSGYSLMQPEGIMAYADLTDNAEAGNGVIFVGVVSPSAHSLTFRSAAHPEGDAIGHLLAPTLVNPGDSLVYFWGAGWSKASVPDMECWIKQLEKFRYRIDNPLKITVRE